MKPLMSEYGASLLKEKPLSEHPNPLFERESWQSLNGSWDFEINKSPNKPEQYSGSIIVPFAVETPLSGVNKKVKKDDFLHYRRFFEIKPSQLESSFLLHFDAVDQICDVYVNGILLAHHEGGYLPFTIYLPKLEKQNVIECLVKDDTDSPIFPRGKQSNKPGGIFYNATSGIWQSVWLEEVPSDGYIASIRTTPFFDERKLDIKGVFTGNLSSGEVEVYFGQHMVAKGTFDENNEVILDFRYDFYPWSTETPNLYQIVLYYGDDVVRSYFAFRKISIVEDGSCKFFALNNKPVFLSAVLDQGYFPDGGLTAPSDQAMIDDISLLKKCGFNAVRKHIKVEPLRWYYHCDKIGLIVMQDFVNGGSPYSPFFMVIHPLFHRHMRDGLGRFLGRGNKESRNEFIREMEPFVDRLYNVPSICIWTLFNEGWGQFEAKLLTKELRNLDPYRLIDSTSGWYDQRCGDFDSYHIYMRPVHIHGDRSRILSLSEFGGYSFYLPQNSYSMKDFGYKKFHSFEQLNTAIKELYERDVIRVINKKGLCCCVFTQLSDVEEEVNGLVSYDRKIQKVSAETMREINEEISQSFSNRFVVKI